MIVKARFTMEFLGQCNSTIEQFIGRSPHFQALAPVARRALIKRNVFWAFLFQNFLLSRQINHLADPKLTLSVVQTFGSHFFQQISQLFHEMDPNETIHKVMFFVSAFFSNGSLITFNGLDDDVLSTTVSIDLIRIQDIYVSMLWKYLVYRYGFAEAVRRYLSLISTILSGYEILKRLDGSKSYDEAYNMVVKQMQSSLIIDEEINQVIF